MKKHYSFIIILFLSVSTVSYGCEICGCANSNFQIGLLPNFSNGFAGFRYSFSRFESRMKSDPEEFSHDFYQSMDLWGGYNFKKIQVMAFMPYIISRKESDEGITNTKGLGDLMLLVNYQILASTALSKNEKATVRHELYLGGGIKLPTGVNQVDVANPDFNIGDFNSQAGTGSVDYMLNATHNLMWNNSGVVTNIAYRINTANQDDYRFGNRTYLNSSYYYTFSKSEMKIKPNVGINFQHNDINHFEGSTIENSNGYAFNSTLGVNLLTQKNGV